MSSAGFVAFKLAYQISPIILTGGIATNLGGAIPIVALTEGANFIASLLSGGENIQLDGFFANYQPLPGATLVNNQVATYPFANQSVAANAIIAQGLNISLLMQCPAKGPAGYLLKLITMQSLQASLAQHNNMGGLYSIVTPSYIYTNCILTRMVDVSGGESRQAQYSWQLDFYQPLLTTAQAQQAQNSLIQTLTNGTPPQGGTPSWTIAGLSVNNPTSLLTSSIIPSGQQ